MEQQTTVDLIERFYRENYSILVRYISSHMNAHKDEAEDLAQMVFLRLLTWERPLREDDLHGLVITIARNLITDYWRRNACHNNWLAETKWEQKTKDETSVSKVYYKDLLGNIRNKLFTFPPQRRKVYEMSLFSDFSIGDIAKKLSIAYKTAEAHLHIGRREMRSYVRQCI